MTMHTFVSSRRQPSDCTAINRVRVRRRLSNRRTPDLGVRLKSLNVRPLRLEGDLRTRLITRISRDLTVDERENARRKGAIRRTLGTLFRFNVTHA